MEPVAILRNYAPLESVMKTFTQEIDSPLGPLHLVASESALLALEFSNVPEKRFPESIHQASDILSATTAQLAEYFQGARQSFSLPLAPEGTEFQKQVWNELLKIPFGKSISYRDLANRIGKPNAIRAVGAANGRNPISILIPCHRVVASNGDLQGYSGTLERKQWLLAHEGERLPL